MSWDVFVLSPPPGIKSLDDTSKTCESKTCESKTCESKTCESKTSESKTSESKTSESKTSESKTSEPPPLGTRVGIIAKIKAVYPQTDFSDPSWGMLQLPDCWIEFSLGADEQVASLAMHVRSGELAPEVVARILDALDVRAIDPNLKNVIFAGSRQCAGIVRAMERISRADP